MENIKSEKEQLTALEGLFQQKRLSDALDTAQKLKEDYPKSFQIHFLHVKILEELNKAGEAETALIELMQMFPNNINLLLEIGKLCTKQNKFGDALEYYNKILFLDPFNSEAKTAIDKINIGKKSGSGRKKGNTAFVSYTSEKLHEADTVAEVDPGALERLTREPQTRKPDILSPPAPPTPSPPPPPVPEEEEEMGIPEEEIEIPEEELEEEEEELDGEKTTVSQPIKSLEQFKQEEQPESEPPSSPSPIEFKIEEIAEFPEEEPPTIPPIPEVEEAEISESLFDSKDGETPEPSETLEVLESSERQEPPQPPEPPEPPFEFKMEEEVQMMEAETDVDTDTETDVDVDEETDRGVDIEIPEAGKSELEAIGVEEAELKHEEPGANEDITAVTEFMVAETETETEMEAETENDADIVTESAAELYLKQGLVNDALVIYNKLYDSQKEERFLIKINQLKRQQATRGKILALTEFLRLIRQKQEQ